MRRPRVEGCRWERSKVSPCFQRLSLIDVNTGRRLGRLIMHREGWFVLVEEAPVSKAHFTRRIRAARQLAAAVGRKIEP